MLEADSIPAPKVALLARAGAARENLREALAHAGVAVVLEEDPNLLTAPLLLAVAPQAVVVALEAAVEDALERLEPVLSSPDFILVFDEAELIARRDGWDAQRWGRHLAAKLHGHQQVLPPGAEQEQSLLPEPGLQHSPVLEHAEAALDFHREQAQDAADAIPGDSLYPSRPMAEPITLEQALAAMTSVQDETPSPAPAPPAIATLLHDHSNWSLLEDDAVPVAAAATEVPSLPDFDLDRLSLVEMEEPSSAGDGRGARGAVLVLAGIGGPDALRRLLAELPARLATAVLVHMPLDGARYGNLVKQMARVSALPVTLGEAGQPVESGQVHILSDAIGVESRKGGLYFVASPIGLQVASLPAAHSAVVLLSGADLGQVDPALTLAEAGAWVGGQVGEGCYDPAAATAVVAAGMFAGEPQELAQAIAARWAGDEQEEGR